MIVRHPLKRLVSAYWDKMGLHVTNPDYQHIRKSVVRAMRPKAAAKEVNTSGPTFQEFITQLLSAKWKWKRDKHWRPYSSLCLPCCVQYDYIIRLETINHDIKPILNILSAGNKTTEDHLTSMLTKINSHSKSHIDNSSQVIPEMLNLSLSQRNELEHIYKLDLQSYNYHFNSVTGEAGMGQF